MVGLDQEGMNAKGLAGEESGTINEAAGDEQTVQIEQEQEEEQVSQDYADAVESPIEVETVQPKPSPSTVEQDPIVNDEAALTHTEPTSSPSPASENAPTAQGPSTQSETAPCDHPETSSSSVSNTTSPYTQPGTTPSSPLPDPVPVSSATSGFLPPSTPPSPSIGRRSLRSSIQPSQTATHYESEQQPASPSPLSLGLMTRSRASSVAPTAAKANGLENYIRTRLPRKFQDFFIPALRPSRGAGTKESSTPSITASPNLFQRQNTPSPSSQARSPANKRQSAMKAKKNVIGMCNNPYEMKAKAASLQVVPQLIPSNGTRTPTSTPRVKKEQKSVDLTPPASAKRQHLVEQANKAKGAKRHDRAANFRAGKEREERLKKEREEKSEKEVEERLKKAKVAKEAFLARRAIETTSAAENMSDPAQQRKSPRAAAETVLGVRKERTTTTSVGVVYPIPLDIPLRSETSETNTATVRKNRSTTTSARVDDDIMVEFPLESESSTGTVRRGWRMPPHQRSLLLAGKRTPATNSAAGKSPAAKGEQKPPSRATLASLPVPRRITRTMTPATEPLRSVEVQDTAGNPVKAMTPSTKKSGTSMQGSESVTPSSSSGIITPPRPKSEADAAALVLRPVTITTPATESTAFVSAQDKQPPEIPALSAASTSDGIQKGTSGDPVAGTAQTESVAPSSDTSRSNTQSSSASESGGQQVAQTQARQTPPTMAVTHDDIDMSLTPVPRSEYVLFPTHLLTPPTPPLPRAREVIEIDDTDAEPPKRKRADSRVTAELRRSRRRTSEPAQEDGEDSYTALEQAEPTLSKNADESSDDGFVVDEEEDTDGTGSYVEVEQPTRQRGSVTGSPSKRGRGRRGLSRGRRSTLNRVQSLPTPTPRVVRNTFSIDMSTPSIVSRSTSVSPPHHLSSQHLPPSTQPLPPSTQSLPPSHQPSLYPFPFASSSASPAPTPPTTQPCTNANLAPQQRIAHNLQSLSEAFSESSTAFFRGQQAYDLVAHDLASLDMRSCGVAGRINDYARFLAQMVRWANVNALAIQNAVAEGSGEAPLTEVPEVRGRRAERVGRDGRELSQG